MQDLKFQLQHYISELWKRRWSILIVMWIVGLVGAVLAARVPDIYTSKATVFVDSNSLMRSILGRDLPVQNPDAPIDNVRKSMYARPNIEEVIRRTDLDLTLNDQRDWEALVQSLSEDMELKRQGRDFYQIEYSHNDPERARNVVQALLDLFVEEGINRSGGAGKDNQATRQYIEGQLNTALARLKTVEAEVAGYERDFRDELAGAPSVSSEKRGLESEVARLEGDRLLYQQELNALRSRLSSTPQQIIERYISPPPAQRNFIPAPIRPTPEPVPQAVQSSEEQQYQANLAQVSGLEAQVQELLRRYTAQHPDVISAQQRVDAARAELAGYRAAAQRASGSIQGEIQAVMQRNAAREAQYQRDYQQWQIQSNAPLPVSEPQPVYAVNPALADLRAQIDQRESRLTVTNARLSEIRRSIGGLQGTLSRQPEILQNYSRLQSEEAKLKGEVERLEEKMEKLLTLDDPKRLNLVEFRVIEPPQTAVTPTGPNRLVLFGAAAILALGAGLGLAFLRVQLADNMPTVAHLKRSFDLPVLGGVSMMERSGETAQAAFSTVIFLAGAAAFATFFAFITYRYHFELWRPDLPGLIEATQKTVGALT